MPNRPPWRDADTPAGSDIHSRPAFDEPYYPDVAEPTDSYFAWIVAELDRLGITVTVKAGQATLDNPKKSTVPERLLRSIRKHRDGLLAYLSRSAGLELPPQETPLPRAGEVVEYLPADFSLCRDPSDLRRRQFNLCTAEDLLKKDWIAWKYRGTKTWFAHSGETFTEG